MSNPALEPAGWNRILSPERVGVLMRYARHIIISMIIIKISIVVIIITIDIAIVVVAAIIANMIDVGFAQSPKNLKS